MSKLLFKGQIDEENLKIRIVKKSSLIIPPKIKHKTEYLWEECLKEAAKKKVSVFESSLYRLEKLEVLKNNLILSLGTVPYSFQKVSKELLKEIKREGEKCYPKGIFVSSVIETKDEKFVFGKRSQSISKNSIDMIGGVLSKDEQIVRDGVDLFDAMRKELSEEINIEKRHIDKFFLKSVILTNNLKIGFIFFTTLNVSAHDLNKIFLQRKDEEMKSLVLIEKRELKNFLMSLGGYKEIISSKVIF